ncbi:MAG: metalloregulator ArsR/SmtB family transcription factor [Beijerinckiaceae bacterium]|jgi:DNA-binding transcriptional ArsR family regulator|nr:metalloregulator ArsR/SmtB family transcription factor [Beijerinckiaceae bacterium]
MTGKPLGDVIAIGHAGCEGSRGSAFVGAGSAAGNHGAVAEAAALMKALAHEGRLEILCCLVDGERTVSEIEQAVGLRQTAVSQQLMRLRHENLVTARRDGRFMHYAIERPEIRQIIDALREAFCARP